MMAIITYPVTHVHDRKYAHVKIKLKKLDFGIDQMYKEEMKRTNTQIREIQ